MAGHPFGAAQLLAMPPSTPPPPHPHQPPSTASRNAPPTTPSAEHGQLTPGTPSQAAVVHSPFGPSLAHHAVMAESHFGQHHHAAAAPSHQIPFNPTPVQHAPTQLTFGFASAPSSSSAAKAFMQPTLPWGSPAPSTSFANVGFGSQARAGFGSPSLSTSFSVGASASTSSSAATSRRSEAKRRRDDDDDDDLDRDSEMSSAVADQSAAGGEAGAASPSRSSRASPGTPPARTARQNLPKRIRAGLVWGGAPSPSSMDESNASSPGGTLWGSSRAAGSSSNAGGAAAAALKLSEEEGVDLGKLLATLDRPSLLLLVTRLLQSSPDSSLPLQMLSHLPSPSLQAVQAALDDAERGIRSVLPSNLSEVRPEYAWGRLKAPILEFVGTVQRFMPFFAGRSGSASGSSQQSKTQVGAAAAAGLGAREAPHPSTTFDFLAEVSARVLRLQSALPPVPPSILAFASAAASSSGGGGTGRSARQGSSTSSPPGASEASRAYSSLLPSALLGLASPNALLSTLVPQLLDAWTELLTSVCRAVNDEGRMFGEETVKAWLGSLEMLGSAGGQADQRKVGGQRREEEEQEGKEKHGRLAESQQQQQQHHHQQQEQNEAKETEAIRRIFDEIHSTVKREIGWLVAR